MDSLASHFKLSGVLVLAMTFQIDFTLIRFKRKFLNLAQMGEYLLCDYPPLAKGQRLLAVRYMF